MLFKPVCRFGEKILQVLVELSHDHMCELLTGLVEAQTSCSVHETPQLLQFLPRQATQINLQNIFNTLNKNLKFVSV